MTWSAWLAWLESTRLAELVGQTAWGFPIAVAVHLLALGLSVGTILWLDLRLLGLAFSACPVSQVYRRLAPWAFTGFAIMFGSGFALFSSNAAEFWANTAFRVKLVALVIAGLNAGFFHFSTSRRLSEWDAAPSLPWPARAAGALSLIAWTIVVAAGRVIPYTMF